MIDRLAKFIGEDIALSLKPVFTAISKNNGEGRLVGGCVRDAILGIKPKDIDLAVSLKPEEIEYALLDAKLPAYRTGFEHGTITTVSSGKSFELTSLRQDKKCLGRKAEVIFCKDWQEDSKRRDFTFNALYMTEYGNIHDYHNGIQDLKDKRLRFVGDPQLRIEEDYLRMFRAFRFWGRFGSKPFPDEVMSAIKIHASKSYLLSGERIREELFKIANENNAFEVFLLMNEANLISYSLLGNETSLTAFVMEQLEKDNLSNKDYLLKIASFITENNQISVQLIRDRLKISNEEMKLLKILLKDTNILLANPEYVRRFILDNGKDAIMRVTSLSKGIMITSGEDPKKVEKLKSIILHEIDTVKNKHELPSGKEIKELGYSGKDIGEVLEKCKAFWIKKKCKIKKKEILKFASKIDLEG